MNSYKYLIVDLDKTLIRSDILVDQMVVLFKRNPFLLLKILFSNFKNKLQIKIEISRYVSVNVSTLPLRQGVLDKIQQERELGKKIILISASLDTYINEFFKKYQLFDEAYGSTDCNLKGTLKADFIKKKFSEGGYAYLADDKSDLAIWKNSEKVIAVNPSFLLRRKIINLNKNYEIINDKMPFLKLIFKTLRIHQYSKNVLIFLPMLAAHQFHESGQIIKSIFAFITFSLSASFVYIMNDLFDISADRLHWKKKLRPLASGYLSIQIAICSLLLLAFLICSILYFSNLKDEFLYVIGFYLTLNFAYTFFLKKILMLDVVTLAALYTVRIFAGSAATNNYISEWLLAFSIFIFFSLALLKRYTEIQNSESQFISGRGYAKSDKEIVISLGVGSALVSILILVLYLNSPKVSALYSNPSTLWLISPIMLFWIGRVWILASRGAVDEDPVLFAIKDKVSLIVLLLILFVFTLSI